VLSTKTPTLDAFVLERAPCMKTPCWVFSCSACVKGWCFQHSKKVLTVSKERNSMWQGGDLLGLLLATASAKLPNRGEVVG